MITKALDGIGDQASKELIKYLLGCQGVYYVYYIEIEAKGQEPTTEQRFEQLALLGLSRGFGCPES